MAYPSQIDVDDTSPTITYYPFGDTFGVPDPRAGWNPYYSGSGFAGSQDEIGVGNSSHLTYLDGASFSVQWMGTGIQLFGNISQATYNTTLDGTSIQANSSSLMNSLLAEFHGLPDTNHTVTLTVHTISPPTSDSYISFDKAVVISTPGPGDNNSTFVSQTADDTEIAFMGQWSVVSLQGQYGHNHSFHQSTHAGDRFEFTFQGRIVTLYGLVSTECGQYSVTLDNRTTTLSARSSFSYPHALLFYATDLDDRIQHQLVVQNEGNHVLAINANGLNYTAVVPSPPPLNTDAATTGGTKAAIALACVLALLFVLIFLCYFFVYRPRVRRNRNESFIRRREKEAEAGVGGVLDISVEARDLAARRGSAGTSFGFAGRKFGMGAQPEKSIDIDIDSCGSWSSLKGASRKPRIDRHSQWDTYTIDLPSIPPNASQRSFRQQSNHREQFPSQSSLRAPRSPKSSFGTRSVHGRLASGALLLDIGAGRDNEESDRGSNKTGEIDYRGVAEFSLSPRTSVAHCFSGVKTSIRCSSSEEDAAQSLPQSNVRSQDLHLSIQEGSPFRVDFNGIGGSSENDSGTGRSPLSQVYPHTDAIDQQEQTQEPLQEPQQSGRVRQISQVKFDPGASDPPPYSKISFLDFGSSISNDASSSSHRSEPEKSRWSTTTGPSQAPSLPSTEPPSASHSTNFEVPPIPPSPQVTSPRPSSFPFPVSMPNSPHHLQVPNFSRNIRRHSSGPSTRQLPLLTIPPSGHRYVAPRSASPTDSVPMSVSDIHFRHISTSESGSYRTSEGSQLLRPYPPLPRSQEPPPTPFIVQKLLGMNTSGLLNPRPGPSSSRDMTPTSIPGSSTPARREPDSGQSTPFMQRVFGLSATVLSPRHNRSASQDVLTSSSKSSSPKSSSSEQSRR